MNKPRANVAGVDLMTLEDVHLVQPDGRVALAGVNLTIQPGERVVLLGANGSGKSTLLKLLDALVFPTRGRYLFEGRAMAGAGTAQGSGNRSFRQRVVMMFQHPEAMLFNPSVREEIAYGLRHLPVDECQRRVTHWAAQLGLTSRLDTPPSELSGGEKQRLCLACLLAVDPQVLLLDEPTANLDPRTVGWLLDWLATQHITTVVATHQLAMAGELGERLLILGEDHTIVFDGPIDRGLADMALLTDQGLAHVHRHRHGGRVHRHPHGHGD